MEKNANILKRLFLSKAERQALFLEKLEEQKQPLTSKQFKKLTKCTLPPEKTYQDFMYEWAAKSKQKQDAQDKFIADAITMLAEAYKAREIQQRYKDAQAEFKSKKNDNFIQPQKSKLHPMGWFRITTACVICLAIGIALFGRSLFSNDGDGTPPATLDGGNITYQAAPPINYSNLSEFYSDLNREGIPFFSLIDDGLAFAEYEADVNDSTLILGYQIQGLGVMASDGSTFYPINFKVTTHDYEFADYEMYENLASSFNCGVTVYFRINNINNDAYITFSNENFGYYIYVKGVYPITQANIQTLIEDLILNR